MSAFGFALLAIFGLAPVPKGGNRQLDIGNPFLMDSTRYPSPVPDGMHVPRIARADSILLAVWQVDPTTTDSQDVRAARLTAGGRVLDPISFRIAGGSWPKTGPCVAFDGTNFLVVWSDHRMTPGGRDRLYGTFVTPLGQVLDTLGFRVGTVDSGQTEPSICFGGGNYFCAWTDNRNSYHTYGARITPAGQVLDPAGVFLNMQFTDHACYEPAVASDGTDYLVGWYDSNYANIYGTRVSVGGQVLDSTLIVFNDRSHYVSHPALTFGAGNYFAAWHDDHGLLGARITPDGVNLDTLSIYINTYSPGTWPAVACAESLYAVIWSYNDRIHGARVAASGDVVDPTGFPVDTTPGGSFLNPALAANGSGFTGVWQSDADRFAIKAASIDLQARVQQYGVARSYVADNQSTASVAGAGTGFLAVWADDRLPAGVYGRRVAADGSSPDSVSFDISRTGNQVSDPTVACGPSGSFAAWSEIRSNRTAVMGRRIASDGTLPDSLPLPLCTLYAQLGACAVAATDSQYLVVFPSGSAIWGVRVSGQGRILDSLPITVARNQTATERPAAARFGDTYLIAWSNNPDDYSIRAARVSSAGVVLDSTPIRIRSSTNDLAGIAVAASVRQFVAVWSEDRYTSYDVYSARILPNGVLVDSTPLPVAFSGDEEMTPAVTFDREKWVVTWIREYTELQGVRLSDEGLMSDLFTLTSDTEFNAPSIAADAHGKVLVAWDMHPYGGYGRVWGALGQWTGIVEGALPQPEDVVFRVEPSVGRHFLIRCPVQPGVAARLGIFDRTGRRVREFALKRAHPGVTTVAWDGADGEGRGVPEGVYFLRLAADSHGRPKDDPNRQLKVTVLREGGF